MAFDFFKKKNDSPAQKPNNMEPKREPNGPKPKFPIWGYLIVLVALIGVQSLFMTGDKGREIP